MKCNHLKVINKLSIMDGSSAPVDPLPDHKQSNNCGDDPLNGYGSKNLAAGENLNNHMFHSGPGSQPAEAWTVGSGGVNPSSFGYPYPPPPGMYDPTGQYPPVESYPPPPAYPPTNHCCHSSLQQQQSVVVINGNPHLIPQPVIPLPRFYYRHMIIACMVFWLCGVLFGLLAFVYAGELTQSRIDLCR